MHLGLLFLFLTARAAPVKDEFSILPVYKTMALYANDQIMVKRPFEKLRAVSHPDAQLVKVSDHFRRQAPEPPMPAPALDHVSDTMREIRERSDGAVFAGPLIHEINRPFADYLYGGDILIHSSQLPLLRSSLRSRNAKPGARLVDDWHRIRGKRGAPVVTAVKWPKDQPIAYSFDSSIDDSVRTLVRSALKKMSENICLDFSEDGSGTQLQFFNGDGCYSYIGQLESQDKQQVSIGDGCGTIGIISHEVSHALGLDHTQNRKDRDTYVTVNVKAIDQDQRHNFDKLANSDNDNFGVTYDYGSDLHYGAYDFSSKGDVTLVPKDSGYLRTMGQRRSLAFTDYKLINTLYKCSESCPTQMKCLNGGYPHPRDCNKCACSDFYTGARCETPVKTITLSASSPSAQSTFEQAFDRDLYNSGHLRDYDMFGHDQPTIIKAPAGRKIKVRIDTLYTAYGKLQCYMECPFNAVEIVDNARADLTLAGKLYCCDDKDKGVEFVSQSNIVGYKAYIAPGMPFQSTVKYTLV